jgi:16S rRNA (guanine(966)-N(2))-methyltransferase RsmD
MRITGGRFGSRPLKAPKGTLTRPTSDRVREALFNILVARGAVRGRVLDLFAGTGALGLEALSRGADEVVLVERSKEALVTLRTNVAALGVADRVRVVASAVERAERSVGEGPFQLVLADPPYADVPSGAAARAIAAVLGLKEPDPRRTRLAEDGILVLEHASRDEAPPIEGLVRGESRTYGDTSLTLFSRLTEPKA